MNTNSKNQKVILKLIIAILIILVIIVIALLGLLSRDKKNNNNEIVLNTTVQQGKDDDITEKSESIDKQEYFNIVTCIKQYLEAINIKSDAYYTYDENGNRVLAIDEINIKEGIYNLLSKNYIEKNGVTVQNVYEKVETMNTSTLFVPLKISKVQNDTIKSFIVYGLVETQDYQAINKIYIIVNIDSANKTYSIEPISKKYNSIQEIKVDKPEKEIEKKDNNTFVTSPTTNEDSAKDYINLYKRLILGDIEEAYKLLEESYKTAKFGSIDNFRKYVEKNKKEIIRIRVEKYQVAQKDGYTQYVCIDQNENYYIIREKGMLDYTLILDTYTIDLPEFTQKYEQASGEEKVLLNLQKIFTAINGKDYKYVYNKLDETFKNNNFKTQEEFEKYIKQNLFENNNVSTGSVEKQGETYLYKLTISDKTGNSSKVVNKTFVMQLKEGTDFVMSFSID